MDPKTVSVLSVILLICGIFSFLGVTTLTFARPWYNKLLKGLLMLCTGFTIIYSIFKICGLM